jgi:hypothetical protein
MSNFDWSVHFDSKSRILTSMQRAGGETVPLVARPRVLRGSRLGDLRGRDGGRLRSRGVGDTGALVAARTSVLTMGLGAEVTLT